ncbi:hypothetical protein DXG01_014140 [Tephrocybe rancida]|nr:hypothetical protein DXG01_014140 [Tephrocybe rancida]
MREEEDKGEIEDKGEDKGGGEVEGEDKGEGEGEDKEVEGDEGEGKGDMEMVEGTHTTPRKNIQQEGTHTTPRTNIQHGDEDTPRQDISVSKRGCAASIASDSDRASKVSKHSTSHSSASSGRSTSLSSESPPVSSRSVSPINFEGSSRSTGGIIHGKATGNVINMGDMQYFTLPPLVRSESSGLWTDTTLSGLTRV